MLFCACINQLLYNLDYDKSREQLRQTDQDRPAEAARYIKTSLPGGTVSHFQPRRGSAPDLTFSCQVVNELTTNSPVERFSKTFYITGSPELGSAYYAYQAGQSHWLTAEGGHSRERKSEGRQCSTALLTIVDTMAVVGC
jgi:hypothetical protein